MGPRPGGFHLLPPRAQEQLNLSTDQQKQVGALEVEVKAKLGTILTAEQLKQLEQLRPRQRQAGQAGGPPGGPDGLPDRE
jgi:Spy/CpxP family protein refolding chaperone